MSLDALQAEGLSVEFQQKLLALSFGSRSAAFIELSPTGHARVFGGDLARYGFGKLARGDDVCDFATFLFGMLPLEKDPVHLPVVRTDEGQFADVHLTATADGGALMLLLDAHQEYDFLTKLQQWGNELELGESQRATEASTKSPNVEARTFEEITAVAFRLRSKCSAGSPVQVLEERAERGRKLAEIATARGGLLLSSGAGDSMLVALFGLVPASRDTSSAIEGVRTAIHASQSFGPGDEPSVGVAHGAVALGSARMAEQRIVAASREAADVVCTSPLACGIPIERAVDLAISAPSGQVLGDESAKPHALQCAQVRPVGEIGPVEGTFVFE